MNLTARWRARRAYDKLDRAEQQIMANLNATGDNAERAFLLDQLAALTRRSADLHGAAYGHRTDLPGDRPYAESIRATAALMRIAAATERGAGAELRGCDPREFGDIPAAERDLWVQLARTHKHAARANLLDGLYRLAIERVGERAAAWLGEYEATERFHADGQQSKRPTPKRIVRRVVGGICIAAGAVLGTAAHHFGQGWLW